MYHSSPHHGWDKAIYSFLVRIGFNQAADGFTADMLTMNLQWEQSVVPDALLELTKGVLDAGSQGHASDHSRALNVQPEGGSDVQIPGLSLDERKLDYIHLANDIPPRTQSTINKDISLFLAQNRARNDASNRQEFVYTPAEKRQRLNEGAGPIPSCARTDARPLDRDVQMKYDIAKNEEGPLSRTVHVAEGNEGQDAGMGKGKGKAADGDGRSIPVLPEEELTAAKRPGLDERLRNIEAHLAVRYVPSAPRTLLGRLKFLEEHLIRLEKDYPPWAALHFSQPNRGWPPPPRQTPIIVPPHLRPKDTPPPQELDRVQGQKRIKNTGSSLHRAVMERLEVKQAMTDLA